MNKATIRFVDDDRELLLSMKSFMETLGWNVRIYETAEAFLAEDDPSDPGCIVVDIAMPEMDGLALQMELNRRQNRWPVVFLSGTGTIAMAVKAMERGAVTFLEKPVNPTELLEVLVRAMSKVMVGEHRNAQVRDVEVRWAKLTGREQQIARMITQSMLNKTIADRLGISVTTVKTHRANIFAKMAVNTAVDLTKQLNLLAAREGEGAR